MRFHVVTAWEMSYRDLMEMSLGEYFDIMFDKLWIAREGPDEEEKALTAAELIQTYKVLQLDQPKRIHATRPL